MNTKNVEGKKYFYYTEKTTLRNLVEVGDREAMPIIETAEKLGLELAGPMEWVYFDCSDNMDKEFTLEIALPVKSEKPYTGNKYAFRDANAFQCISHLHKGDLAKIANTYEGLFKDIMSKNINITNEIREVYENYEGYNSPSNLTEIQIGLN